jgi:hypothetical protein
MWSDKDVYLADVVTRQRPVRQVIIATVLTTRLQLLSDEHRLNMEVDLQSFFGLYVT